MQWSQNQQTMLVMLELRTATQHNFLLLHPVLLMATVTLTGEITMIVGKIILMVMVRVW